MAVFFVLVVAGLCLFAYVMLKRAQNVDMVCTRCYTIDVPKSQVKGSFLIELILWLMFILPGLLYSLWRVNSKHKVCGSCGSVEIVPVSSTRGQQIIAQNGLNPNEAIEKVEEEYAWLKS